MTFRYVTLPLYQDTNYRYTVSLENRQRTLAFYWNEREGAWHFDLKNIDGTPILLGQKIVPQYPIAVDYRLEGFDLTGYFVLMPNNISSKVDPNDSAVVPQFFKFYYVHEVTE